MHINDNEFDQYIRSMMIDGEEEVPSRLWSSIASKAGIAPIAEKATAVPAYKSKRLNWRYALASLSAVAASVAVFLLVFKPEDKHQDEFRVADNAVHQEQAEAETYALAKSSASITGMISSTAEVAEKEDEVPVMKDSIAESEQTVEKENGATTTETIQADSSVSDTDSRDTVDPFAMMAFEESRKSSKRRIALHLGGSIFTNSNANGLRPKYLATFDPNKSSAAIEQTSKESSYSIPVTVGLGVKIPFSDSWSIVTGLSYSFMQRGFTGVWTGKMDNTVKSIKSDNIQHYLHYIGIPVNFNYDLYKSDRTQFYTYFGARMEKSIVNKYMVPDGTDGYISCTQGVKGLQFSASLGLGINFLINDYFGIYFDPSLQYFFDCNQPTSIRTQQPVQMGFEAGLRFHFQ